MKVFQKNDRAGSSQPPQDRQEFAGWASFLATAPLDKYFSPSELPPNSTQVMQAYDRTVCLSRGSVWGTGVLLSDQYLLTCSHVISGLLSGTDSWKEIRAKSRLAEFDLESAVIEINNPELDFAVIRSPALRDSSAIKAGIHASLYLGDRCYLIGNPSYATFGRPEVKRNSGQVISIGRIEEVSASQVYMSGSTINPGYSGGPIIARDGTLIGIMSEQYRSGARGPTMSAILNSILGEKGA